jgi:hypothetical protein
LKKAWVWVGGATVLALVGTGASMWLWLTQASPAPHAPPAPADEPVAAVPPVAVGSAVVASAPEFAVRQPLDSASAAEAPAAPPDVEATLSDLFGSKAVLSMFQTRDFARRVAATVDNLGRAHASARLWPVNPAPGRFTVQRLDDTDVISADNGLRYTPYLLLLETVDMRQLAEAYVQLYPLFQRAYEDLGYPKRRFNDRLIEVIDLLLATPGPAGPLAVRLPTINGPIQPERPWVLYEFDDPALQALPSGQRLVLRIGPVNERRLKARLAEFRGLVADGAVPR